MGSFGKLLFLFWRTSFCLSTSRSHESSVAMRTKLIKMSFSHEWTFFLPVDLRGSTIICHVCLWTPSLVLQIVETVFNALNQNLVQFELKPGVQVIVYVTQLTLGEYLWIQGMWRWMSYDFEQKKEGTLSEPFSIDDATPKPVCVIKGWWYLGSYCRKTFFTSGFIIEFLILFWENVTFLWLYIWGGWVMWVVLGFFKGLWFWVSIRGQLRKL